MPADGELQHPGRDHLRVVGAHEHPQRLDRLAGLGDRALHALVRFAGGAPLGRHHTARRFSRSNGARAGRRPTRGAAARRAAPAWAILEPIPWRRASSPGSQQAMSSPSPFRTSSRVTCWSLLCDTLVAEFPPDDVVADGQPARSNRRFSYSASKAIEDIRLSRAWRDFIRTHVSQGFLDDLVRLFGDHVGRLYPDLRRDRPLRAGVRYAILRPGRRPARRPGVHQHAGHRTFLLGPSRSRRRTVEAVRRAVLPEAPGRRLAGRRPGALPAPRPDVRVPCPALHGGAVRRPGRDREVRAERPGPVRQLAALLHGVSVLTRRRGRGASSTWWPRSAPPSSIWTATRRPSSAR